MYLCVSLCALVHSLALPLNFPIEFFAMHYCAVPYHAMSLRIFPPPLPLSISSYVCVRKIAVKKYTLNYPMVLAVPLYAAQTEARIMIWLLKSTLLVFPLLFSPAIFSIYLFLCVLFFGSLACIHVILSPLFYFLFHNSVCRTKSLDIFFYETIMIALLILVRRR